MATNPAVERSPEWPDARQYRRSLRWEFPLYLVVLVTVLMSVAGYLFTRQYVTEVTSNVVNQLLIQARSHAASAAKDILSPDGPDVLRLSSLCRELAATNPELYWSGVADDQGLFLAHTDIRLLTGGGRLRLPVTPADVQTGPYDSRAYTVQDTLYIYVPIRERQVTIGHLALAFPTEKIQKARTNSIVTVTTVTLVTILIGIPMVLWLVSRKLRPISTIVTHLRNVDPSNPSLDIPVGGKNELAYLAETLRVMGIHLRTTQEERLQTDRMVRELEIAREIQIGILPRKFPTGPSYEFCGTYISANQVGGDYYDFLPFDNHRLGFLIADVSGKSLPGMLFMLMTRDIIRSVATPDRDPRQVMCDLNRELLGTIRKGMFVTMLYGLLDLRTGHVAVASAGHNPIIWISSTQGTTSLVRPPGYPLGLMEPAVFDQRIESQRIELTAGDWLVQFTDGVNEARNPEGTEYGMDRLTQALLTKRQLEPADFINSTLEDHCTFVGSAPQFDDITLVAMKWRGNPIARTGQEIDWYAASV